MTKGELLQAWNASNYNNRPLLHVRGRKPFDGYLVAIFTERVSHQLACVVESDKGRCAVVKADQVEPAE